MSATSSLSYHADIACIIVGCGVIPIITTQRLTSHHLSQAQKTKQLSDKTTDLSRSGSSR